MTIIAHLSDLHFGREDADVTSSLVKDLTRRPPDLAVITGDVTQRARPREFEAARAFLDQLRSPWLVVPGNHDVPFYDAWRRFFTPLDRFRRFIHQDPEPSWQDDDVVVLGINTARSATWKDGRISYAQIAAMRERLLECDPNSFRIVASHHPLLPDRPKTETVARAPLAVKAMEEGHVDVALSGHLHTGWLDDFAVALPTARKSILSLHAGTTVSRRRRGESNSYNWLQATAGHLAVDVRAWNGHRFESRRHLRYEKDSAGWRPQTQTATAAA